MLNRWVLPTPNLTSLARDDRWSGSESQHGIQRTPKKR